MTNRKGVSSMTGPDDDKEKDDRDNRADQLNPNNDAYWQSRGNDGKDDRDDDDDD